jgi:hypothetical protein
VVAVLLGILSSTATAGAKSSERRVIATAATVRLTEVKAKAAERDVRYLRVVARRACATHRKRACRASRKHLAKAQARVSHLQQILHWLMSGAGASNASSSAGAGSGTAKSPLVERPQFSPPPPPSGFQPGLDSGTNMGTDVAGAAQLGTKVVRIEFGIGTPASQLAPVIEGYASKGIRVAPMAGFHARLPSPAEAQNLASWASAYGRGGTFWSGRSDGQLAVQAIEFGNETSYGYQYGDGPGDPSYTARAQTYAVRLKEAAEAISATGTSVGVLAQADDWSGDWVNAMYSAVPNLSNYVGGWTIHPYGTGWQSRLTGMIAQTAAHGAPSSIPIDVTEWGVATDNGRCLSNNYGWNPCMTYGEAASTLNGSVAEMRRILGSRLAMFILYQVRDQKPSGASSEREAYFGALQQDLQPKGAFTAQVQSLLASS